MLSSQQKKNLFEPSLARCTYKTSAICIPWPWPHDVVMRATHTRQQLVWAIFDICHPHNSAKRPCCSAAHWEVLHKTILSTKYCVCFTFLTSIRCRFSFVASCFIFLPSYEFTQESTNELLSGKDVSYTPKKRDIHSRLKVYEPRQAIALAFSRIHFETIICVPSLNLRTKNSKSIRQDSLKQLQKRRQICIRRSWCDQSR